MANTSTRTLQLLSLLQARRYWPGAELAERLRVSPRTLRRDIDRPRELGYPVQAQRGVEGGYQLEAGAALPPLLVDDEEAVALAVGLQTAAQGAVEGIAESSVRALAKVVQVMPTRLRRRVEALGAMTVPASWGSETRAGTDPHILTTVALACRDSERLRFSYIAAGGEQTARHVEPHRLVLLTRRWYLVGYDLTRHDWRTFRLDRLSGPRGTGARFRPRDLPAADAAAFVRAGIKAPPGARCAYRQGFGGRAECAANSAHRRGLGCGLVRGVRVPVVVSGDRRPGAPAPPGPGDPGQSGAVTVRCQEGRSSRSAGLKIGFLR